MRAYLADYDLRAPRTLAETLGLLKSQPGVWTPFAGGTDLMVVFETGKLAPKKFLSVFHLPELKGIRETETHLELGAAVTYSELRAHPLMRFEFGLLCEAARETGAVAIQNRGTLGGNIANASPAADSPPALLVYEAELELVSADGARVVPYSTFHTGYKKTVLRAGELIRAIRLRRGASSAGGWHQYYRKAGTRKAQAISKVCLAARARVENGKIAEARVAFGAMAPTPLRVSQVEAVLVGRAPDAKLVNDARAALAAALKPIDDIRSTADFRQAVAGNLLEEFICGIGSASSRS